jgi:phosphoenolpyruvate carboxylase
MKKEKRKEMDVPKDFADFFSIGSKVKFEIRNLNVASRASKRDRCACKIKGKIKDTRGSSFR